MRVPPILPAAIHAAGLVRRDLKASNVLLAEDGPCVIDFGISQASESRNSKTTGAVNSTTFPVDPGSWTCFRVQAVSGAGDSSFSGYGCVQTPAP
jgi:serine/threonine protein kinase